MASEAENLASLRVIYAQLLVDIATLSLTTGPDFSVDSVSLQDGTNLDKLFARLAQLQKIPGVAQLPIFEVHSVAR